MKNKINYIYLICISICLSYTSCNDFLDREPISSITPEVYFKTADELGAYAIKYYTDVFRTTHGAYNTGPIGYDDNTDNMIEGEASTSLFAKGNKYVPTAKNTSFSYTVIRPMNYFLDQVLPKYEAGTIEGSEETIRHYIGEIYFLRAYMYFEKLKLYGDFPIITEALPDEPEILVAKSERAPRNEVARFIIEDLNKAIELLQSGNTFGKQRIGKELAQLFKARVALYEATFETYHKGTPRIPGESGWPGAGMAYNAGKSFDIDGEISYFLNVAMEASAEVADHHSLVNNSGVINPAVNQYYGWNPYFEMFSMPNPSSLDEVMLWREYSRDQSISYGWNTYVRTGGNNGATRSYVNAFLMANGLPIYNPGSGYKGDETIVEQKTDRDGRLRLFLFDEETPLVNEGEIRYYSAPNIISPTTAERDRTGFRFRKHFTYDPEQNQTSGLYGTNGYILFRAAEAYLIYIEASYLKNGIIDSRADRYWKALRERAQVDEDYTKTIQATDLAQEPDWAKYSGSGLVDATLYNIRRERRCEFIAEGMRDMDLKRWRSYDALFDENMGPYIPEGVNLWTKIYTYDEYQELDENGNPTGNTKFSEQAPGNSGANVSNRSDSKYLRPYRTIQENNLVWDGYTWMKAYYLEPIPIEDMQLTSPDGSAENSLIYQNPYWPSEPNATATE